jgi:hypothetical protein
MELVIHQFMWSGIDGALNADGSYKILLTEEMLKDARVQKRIEALQPERAHRMKAVNSTAALQDAAQKLREAVASMNGHAVGNADDDTPLVERAARLAPLLSANDELRLGQLKQLFKDNEKLAPYVANAWDELMDDARHRQGKPVVGALWDQLAKDMAPVPRKMLKLEVFRIAYGGKSKSNNLDAAKEIFNHLTRYESEKNPVWNEDLSFLRNQLAEYIAKTMHEQAVEVAERAAAQSKLSVGPLAVGAAAGATLADSVSLTESVRVEEKKPVSEEKNMTDISKKSLGSRIVATAKEDGADMAYRVAARQAARLVRDPLAAAVANKFGTTARERNKIRDQISAFLNTDLGLGVVMALMGVAVTSLPFDDERLDALAKELRVAGITEFGDMGAELLLAPFREVLVGVVSGLPPVNKVRVDATETKTKESIAEKRKQLEEKLRELEAEEAEVASKTAAVAAAG